MLEEEELDCVHICLPHYLHLPATKACVEKGIHVFQEKPLALNTDEGVEVSEIRRRTSRCENLYLLSKPL